eukprot:c23432_g2_i1 orf=2-208(-)
MQLIWNMSSMGCKPNTITYNNLLDGLLKANKGKMALSILSEMREKACNPDTITCNALIDWFVNKGETGA